LWSLSASSGRVQAEIPHAVMIISPDVLLGSSAGGLPSQGLARGLRILY
jgi:hypothetical protein